MRLILASASPRRAELLRTAGYTFEVQVADVDERVLPGELPAAYVRRLAHEKAARVFRVVEAATDNRPGAASRAAGDAVRPGDDVPAADPLVLAADTAVVVDGEILGKPADADDAARMIRLISGRTHQVLTGVAVRAPGFVRDLVERTTVEVVRLTDEQVAWYVGTGEGRDKAGAYAIQGLFSRFVAGIAGSYANVVGLPIAPVAALIEAAAPGVRAVASGGY